MSNPFITNDQLKLFLTTQVVQSIYDTPTINACNQQHLHNQNCQPVRSNNIVEPLLYYALGEIMKQNFKRF